MGGAILRGQGRPIVNYSHSAVSCAETAEPLQLLFRIWTWWA